MSKRSNWVGKRIGKLTVIDRGSNTNHGETTWVCRCDCGNEITLRNYYIKYEKKFDCGCVQRPHFNTTHGGSNTALYNTWKLMIYRCENPKNHAYKYYGQRGITVCEEWHDFTTFKKWVDENKPSNDFTIDRIDNAKGYSPENCRFASPKTQSNNRRSNIEIEYKGETHNLSEWSELLGFNYKNVHNRMYKLGWTFEKAISTPIDIKKRNKVERKNSE